MPADFYASYASGAIGVCIGNRLDIWKTELQSGNRYFISRQLLDRSDPTFRGWASMLRGAAAPVLSYGALNTVLFTTYNRCLKALDPSISDSSKLAGVALSNVWTAGAAGGLACWFISAPSELIKCRTQLMINNQSSSYATAVDIYKRSGIPGFYLGGAITSLRDTVGFAWYFWSYELSKRLLSQQADPFAEPRAREILLAGGIAGIITWVSIYPLDVVKTRAQTFSAPEQMLSGGARIVSKTAWSISKDIVRTEGIAGFFRGLFPCTLRAFFVNAVQFYIYENIMKFFNAPKRSVK